MGTNVELCMLGAIAGIDTVIIDYIDANSVKILYTYLFQFGLYEKIQRRKKNELWYSMKYYMSRENFWLDKSLF